MSATFHEVDYILKVTGGHIRSQHLSRFERRTVACENISDLALGDRHQRRDVNRVLNGHPVMQTTAQHLRLEAGLAVQGDQAGFQRLAAESFFDDTDAVVGDKADSRQQDQEENANSPYTQCNKDFHFVSFNLYIRFSRIRGSMPGRG